MFRNVYDFIVWSISPCKVSNFELIDLTKINRWQLGIEVKPFRQPAREYHYYRSVNRWKMKCKTPRHRTSWLKNCASDMDRARKFSSGKQPKRYRSYYWLPNVLAEKGTLDGEGLKNKAENSCSWILSLWR